MMSNTITKNENLVPGVSNFDEALSELILCLLNGPAHGRIIFTIDARVEFRDASKVL